MNRLFYSVVLIACTSTALSAQTVADRAREARANRKNPPAKIVITNVNIPVDDTILGNVADAEEKDEKETKAEAPAHDEKYWRQQFTDARAEIQKLQGQIPVLENDWNAKNNEFLQRSFDPDGRGQSAITESKAKLDSAKGNLAKAQEKLTKLEGDMHREGAPAGWAR